VFINAEEMKLIEKVFMKERRNQELKEAQIRHADWKKADKQAAKNSEPIWLGSED
jgi:hypothetical protein